MAGLSVNVEMKDLDICKEAIFLLKEISVREDTPEDIKNKIKDYVSRWTQGGAGD